MTTINEFLEQYDELTRKRIKARCPMPFTLADLENAARIIAAGGTSEREGDDWHMSAAERARGHRGIAAARAALERDDPS